MLANLLDLDLHDSKAVEAFWDRYLRDERFPVETPDMAVLQAAQGLVLLVTSALKPSEPTRRIRLLRSHAATEKPETTEERRACVVKLIEIARGDHLCQCPHCGAWTSAEVCERNNCKKPVGINVTPALFDLVRLDNAFSKLDPETVNSALERWRSCTLIAAHLSILAGAFDDSGDARDREYARKIQKRFDLAYRQVFGRAPLTSDMPNNPGK